MIYVDTETERIEQGRLAPPLVCLQAAIGDEDPWLAVAGVDPVEDIARELLRADDVIVGHNIAYDMLVLATEYPMLWPDIIAAYDDDRVTDTMLREQLVAIALGRRKREQFTLAALAEKYGGEKDADDPWRQSYFQLRGTPVERWPASARRYALHDVEATRLVYQAQSAPMVFVAPIEPMVPKRPHVSTDEFRQARAALVLQTISATGVQTDPDAIRALEARAVAERDADFQTLLAAGLARENGSRNAKAAQKLMLELNPDGPRTRTGKPSLDQDVVEQLGDERLLAYQRYGSWTNFRSRIKRLWQGVRKPLNPRFTVLMETGRTSCSAGDYGYQVQNMRRTEGERECFVPREPGNVFLACDFDSFELCTLAQVCNLVVGYSELGEAINRGVDPHLLMAARSTGRDYKEMKAILADPEHSDYKAVKLARQGSKIANFGYPGGMGARSFVSYARGYGMTLSEEQAETLRANWFESWPEMSGYFTWINEDHEWVEYVINGEDWKVTTVCHPWSGRIRGMCSYTVACNSYFQGLAADAAKSAGWELLQLTLPGAPLERWRIWNFVHDEFLLEGPEEEAAEAAKLVEQTMVDAAGAWLPDVTVRATAALMRRWRKAAEPVYRDGKLVPWEDR